MGKKQHQKDKMYLTMTEWSTLYGGKKANSQNSQASAEFRRLPFDHCALSLQPFETPYADSHGNVFDLTALLPFLKKFKVNPITGEKLEAKQLTKLNFTKNADGEYHCPVLYKVFNANSHIVFVKPTGNVFSYDAIEELNIKPKNWKDLLTDEPFTRPDLMTIQDPKNLKKFNLVDFHHLKHKLRIEDEELVRAGFDPNARLKTTNSETKHSIEELNRTYKSVKKETQEHKKADTVNAAHYSTGSVAASFTSTVMPVSTVHEAAIRDEDSVRYERIKKKGYVRLNTNMGQINLELHCDSTHKTCENFILLCKRGYYNGNLFHRSIKHFMVQGGDPTGKGTGGESAWGPEPFEDEIKPNLHHEGRGVLSMANSGPDSNKSQFFITYRSCKHLDGKHTIFGRVVGGMDTLSTIEKIEVDNKDRPIEDIQIQSTTIFVDPFAEVDEVLAKERQKEVDRLEEERKAVEIKRKPKKEPTLKVYREGVGKYINPKRKADEDTLAESVADTKSGKKKPSSSYEFKNFGSW